MILADEPTTRKPWLAPILGMLMPGLGHLYGGDLRKALAVFATYPVLLCIAGWFGWLYRLPSFYIAVFFVALVLLAQVANAYFVARKNRHAEKKWYSRWYGLLAIYLIGFVLFQLTLLNRAALFNYETFRQPSSSMQPTLEKGDVFLAKPVRSTDALRGRVIVFRFPEDPSIFYVKRVVALPGDSIEMKDGRVFVNDVEMNAPYLYREERVKSSKVADFAKTTVPADGVFVLGDNLYNSYDSRFWGNVPFQNVVAAPTYIWFSSDPGRMGKLIQSVD